MPHAMNANSEVSFRRRENSEIDNRYFFLDVFFGKMCVFGRFPALAQKIYLIHFFRPDKNFMSLLKRIGQFPPP